MISHKVTGKKASQRTKVGKRREHSAQRISVKESKRAYTRNRIREHFLTKELNRSRLGSETASQIVVQYRM